MPVGVGAAIAGAVGLGGIAGGIAATGINAALFLGLSAASSALAQRELKKQGIAPRDAVVRGGDFPKIVVYGDAVVGGVMAYINQRDVGNDDFELWVALVHAAHECNSVLGVYYEDHFIDFATDVDGNGDHNDTSSPWYAVATSGPDTYAARLWRYDGTQTTANTEFVSAFSDITSNFRLQGYAYTLHRWTLWQGSEEIFKGGEPSNIRARIQGKKVKTSELGSPTYSANPIWVAVDYMREYMGISDSRFDWTDLATQAAVCDVTVSTPAGNQARYSCNGAISLGDSHDDNLQKILATCLGFRSTVNGKIRITAGGDLTSTVSLDETDIIAQANGSPVPATIRTAVPREERYNKVTGTYISADAGYTSTEFQPQEEANFVTRDNGETITKQIQLDMVTDEYLAQRIAYKHLQQSDQQVTCELPLRWSGLRLTPGTYCSVTYDKFNWSSKLFRCESVRIGERGVPVTAVLREDSASAWTDPASPGDYTQILPDGSISKPAESVPVPTSMTATPFASGGGWIGNIIQWQNPSVSPTWDYVNVYASATSAWSGAALVGSRITSGQFNHELPANTTRYYWVRAVRNGVESLREPNSDTSNRTATSPAAFPTIGAQAGTNLLDAAGNVISDDVITNFDDATALGFNPAFATWPAGQDYPTGWSASGGVPPTRNFVTLAGPYSVRYDPTGASRLGMSSSANLAYDVDSIIIGSYDCWIDSAGTTGTPGLNIQMFQSASNYVSGNAVPDLSKTGQWQRVYFKLSRRTGLIIGSPTSFSAINLFVLASWTGFDGNLFDGQVIFDNLRFAILSPDIENEAQLWADVSGSGKPADNATRNDLQKTLEFASDVYNNPGTPVTSKPAQDTITYAAATTRPLRFTIELAQVDVEFNSGSAPASGYVGYVRVGIDHGGSTRAVQVLPVIRTANYGLIYTWRCEFGGLTWLDPSPVVGNNDYTVWVEGLDDEMRLNYDQISIAANIEIAEDQD